ncbi:MAG: sigma-70 family RNA polymerase sigma factor [Pirellulaceae bacterium]
MSSASELVEHYFRHEYGRLVALLASRLGVRYLELAEDVVQSALSRALTAWPRSGVPNDPSAWLYRTAKNLALDALRREQLAERVLHGQVAPIDDSTNSPEGVVQFDSEIGDETLRLLFLCCHPAIAPESRVALALKTVGGFSVSEIASGLLTTADNVERRLTRAKEKLREAKAEITELNSAEVVSRMESVLSTVYLIFNEGFFASSGDSPIRDDLCAEAIRLAQMIAGHPICGCPTVYAQVALFLMHSARLNSRLDASGTTILLADQDRSQWNWDLIREAMSWMEKSATGDLLSRYHIEAAIAWEHCRATDFAATDWRRIVQLYGTLLDRFATPMIRLNAAIASSYADGPEAGREQLLAIDAVDRKRLRPWWDCCMAQLHERAGVPAAALSHWRDALALATTSPQRQFVQSQIDRLT